MKELFTTGDVADICRISQQTVIRCFDAGKIEGFRVPGLKIPQDSAPESHQIYEGKTISRSTISSQAKRKFLSLMMMLK